jgi:acyl-CoA synthetase (AMP-forming)/AMP-acid ligase II
VEAACRERLAGFKTPRQIVFQIEPLPRTPTGKVQKFLLVERFSRAG